MIPLKPADVLVVRGSGAAGWWIRFGAALKGLPNLDGHVAMFDHYDSSGVPWGIEGRPGGVGQVDLRPYLRDPFMVNNCGQPGRTDADRELARADMKVIEGTAYDWAAILGDGFDDLHVELWNLPEFSSTVKPGHVVCSSAAAYIYQKRGWAHPSLNRERYCQPGDWTQFIIENKWSAR